MLNRLPRHLPPLSVLLNDMGRPTPKALAKALDVDESTVRRWIRADMAPRPVALALFWLTRWGQSSVYAEAVNQARLYFAVSNSLDSENEQLRAQVSMLLRVGHFASANDSIFDVSHANPLSHFLRDRAQSLRDRTHSGFVPAGNDP